MITPRHGGTLPAISSHVAGQGAASPSPLGVLFGTMINLTAAILVHMVHSAYSLPGVGDASNICLDTCPLFIPSCFIRMYSHAPDTLYKMKI